MSHRSALSTSALAVALLLTGLVPGGTRAASLIGRAVVPADTFEVGPTSGQFITPANGRTPPFVKRQPVQGFSAVLRASHGEYFAMPDNGYGAKANSADFLLGVYRLSPEFTTAAHGTGTVRVELAFHLSDPYRRINFPIVADQANYPNGSGSVPVDPEIRHDRLLTGADFDIESFRQVADGTFWFGDEFGPFLIHTDRKGRVLEAPIPLPGVQSPDNPFLGTGTPNLLRSKGFEGMALARDRRFLYPMLEGALTTDPDNRRLFINEFDIKARSYTGRRWAYRMADAGNSIGDLTAVNDHVFLVIERDNNQGAAAAFKKIFLIDLQKVDGSGFLEKHQIVDLLNIADPGNVSGTGAGTFTFPFQTIESVLPIDARTLVVLNDNNYPFSSGRTPGQPDNNEIIIIRLDEWLPLAGSPLEDCDGESDHGDDGH